MKVIINADDLGYSLDTNRAIFELMDHRKITSATLLANGPAFEDAVKRIPSYQDFSFGVHLNITEFYSLTCPNVFYDEGIIDDKGIFTGNLSKAVPTRFLKDAILQEWEQQVKKILDNGIKISHFDSHHHTHTLPWLFMSLKKLQMKFGIRKVRGTMNWYHHEHRPSLGLSLRKGAWRWALQNIYLTKTTDYFTKFDWFLADLVDGSKDMQRILELMCHPGHPYYPGQDYSIYEKEQLWSDWAHKCQFGVELISYNQL